MYSLLRKSLSRLEIHGNFLNLIRVSTKNLEQINDESLEIFPFKKEIRRRCLLSLFPFNILLAVQQKDEKACDWKERNRTIITHKWYHSCARIQETQWVNYLK